MTYSIIIPSYNQQEYLPDAIESALAQTVPAHEIIVVDDGSTDSSRAIAKGYAPRIRVISQVNKGLSSARNTGIMAATGDYIIPLDADDILKENYIEVIDTTIAATDADIVAPSFKCFGVGTAEVILDTHLVLESFKEANRIGYFSAIRRSLLVDIGGYSPKMAWGYEDWHVWINLLSRGANLITLKDVLVLYRTKLQSMIHVANAHKDELMAQIHKDFPHLYA